MTTMTKSTKVTSMRATLAPATLSALFTVFAGATPATAQLPQASAAAFGLGFNNTASARGFAAIASNPAGLGVSDNPGFTLAIPALVVEMGLGPVTLADLADWEGRVLPDAVRDAWYESVVAAGGQTGSMGLGATPFAASVGPIGIQLSSQVGGQVSLGPDAIELLLYGNAGRTGTAGDFELAGSTIDAFVLSTAAVSWGMRVSERLHLGVTGSYSVGTGLVVGRDAGTMLRSDPLSADIEFPVLFPSDSIDFDNGSGFGLDVGAVWVGDGVTVGATIQNVVNTFEWRVDDFLYTPGQAYFAPGDADSDFEEIPANQAPQELLDLVADLGIRPTYAVGVELTPSRLLSLTADLRKRASGGLAFGPEFHAGVGAELRMLSFLPLRAHLAKVSGGTQLGGGASLVLGPVNLSGGIALRTGETSDATLGMFTLSFGGR